MKYSIRAYIPEDKPFIEKICTEDVSDEKLKEAILKCFCRYYIDEEPQNCFVAANEKNEAVGYILCAENFGVWKDKFLRGLSEKADEISIEIGRATLKALEAFSSDYPAHLHIDLLPSARGRGAGTMLIEKLKRHLKNNGVSGLMLDIATDNLSARRFYEKNLFEYLNINDTECVMGIKLC